MNALMLYCTLSVSSPLPDNVYYYQAPMPRLGKAEIAALEKQKWKSYLQDQRKMWIAAGVLEVYDTCNFKYRYSWDRDTKDMLLRIKLGVFSFPDANDVFSLPTKCECDYSIKIIYAYRKQLRYELEYLDAEARHVKDKYFWQTLILWALLADLEKRHAIWKQIQTCNNGLRGAYNAIRGTRYELQELKTLVGEEVYKNLDWPRPLPNVAYIKPWRILEDD